MKGSVQDVWVKDADTTYFKLIVTLEDGREGEVKSLTPEGRFEAGETVTVTSWTEPTNPKYPGALKLDKPRDVPQAGGPRPSSGGWSPEKETRIEVQGLVQAAIAGGAKTPQDIEALVKLGMTSVSAIAPKVLAARAAKAVADAGTAKPEAVSPQLRPAQAAVESIRIGDEVHQMDLSSPF